MASYGLEFMNILAYEHISKDNYEYYDSFVTRSEYKEMLSILNELAKKNEDLLKENNRLTNELNNIQYLQMKVPNFNVFSMSKKELNDLLEEIKKIKEDTSDIEKMKREIKELHRYLRKTTSYRGPR